LPGRNPLSNWGNGKGKGNRQSKEELSGEKIKEAQREKREVDQEDRRVPRIPNGARASSSKEKSKRRRGWGRLRNQGRGGQ